MRHFQDFSIHTHTGMGDGYHSITEMIESAKKAGLKTIGISDHYWAVGDRLQEYVKMVRTEQDKQQFQILLGLEVDLPAPEKWSELYRIKRDFGFDYFIGSLHNLPMNGQRYYVGVPDNKTVTQTHEFQKLYWKTLPNLACDLFDIVAHMDLIKMTGVKTEPQFEQEIDSAIKAFKKNNQIVEINTKHSKMENEPSDTILDRVRCADIPVIFSSDAHAEYQVTYRFMEEQLRLAATLAKMHHITQTDDLLRFLRTRNVGLVR